jgi:hypothetical protein
MAQFSIVMHMHAYISHLLPPPWRLRLWKLCDLYLGRASRFETCHHRQSGWCFLSNLQIKTECCSDNGNAPIMLSRLDGTNA